MLVVLAQVSGFWTLMNSNIEISVLLGAGTLFCVFVPGVLAKKLA